MVAPKVTGGSSVQVALQYDINGRLGVSKEPRGEWVAGTCVGSNTAELVAQFKPILNLRTETKKPVWRCSINLHPSDGRLTAAEWCVVCLRFLQLMGVDPALVAWCSINHRDRKHDHTHITLCRILLDGSLWDHAFDVPRAIKACAQIERESMQLLGRQLHTHDRSPKDKRSLSMSERKLKEAGLLVSREFIQQKVDHVIKSRPHGICLTDFVCELKSLGVEARPYFSEGDLKGISYSAEDISWPGGKLGKAYTNTGLVARGVIDEAESGVMDAVFFSPMPLASASMEPAPVALPTVTPAQAENACQALETAFVNATTQFDEARQAGVREYLICMAIDIAVAMTSAVESMFQLPQGSLGSWAYRSSESVNSLPPRHAEVADVANLAQAQGSLVLHLSKLLEALKSGDMEKLPEIPDSRYQALREKFAEANHDAIDPDQYSGDQHQAN